MQPDRGFNVYGCFTLINDYSCLFTFCSHSDGTIDYQGRQHQVDFVLNPYYSTTKLSFTQAQQTLQLTYKNTLLYTERSNGKTTGLDAGGVRAAQSGFPTDPLADPQMPIPKKSDNRLTLDLEGLVLNSDGS